MKLDKESDAQLLIETKNIVSCLNEKNVEFLERLREIDHRKLHLERGFSSLFAFVTEELGFSAGAAMRRINSMRLLKDLPEIRDQISKGVLNLTTVSQAQHFFKKENYSRVAKCELLATLEKKSSREVDKVLASYSPEVITPDRMKPVSLNRNEVKFIADDRLVEKLEKLKALRSHSDQTLNDLVNAMADLCLEKWEPKIRLASSAMGKPEDFVPMNPTTKNELSSKSKVKPGIIAEFKGRGESEVETFSKAITGIMTKARLETKIEFNVNAEAKGAPESTLKLIAKKGQSNECEKLVTPAPNRYISKKLKAAIYARDQGRCQYTDSLTLKKCHSRHFVQIDHVEPFALGGKSIEENLRLYCSAHNQLRGQKTFGYSTSRFSSK